jgi:hypothetical protein
MGRKEAQNADCGLPRGEEKGTTYAVSISVKLIGFILKSDVDIDLKRSLVTNCFSEIFD